MFFNKLSGLVRGPRALSPTHRFVEKVVAALGPSIAEADNFEPILAQALHSAELYYHQQIQAIPGPFEISASDPGNNPFVQTVFPSRDDVMAALGRSIEVRDFLPALARDGNLEFFALLGCREKVMAGHEPGLQFADHTVRSIGHSEEYCRESLRNSCLHRLLGQFRAHVDTLRHRGKIPKAEWNIANRANAAAADADQATEFVLAEQELSPDKLLKGLVAWLETPEVHLRIESSAAVGADQRGARAELPVMHCADRRQWSVSLVQIPVEEAVNALASESHCHRYILI
ncbi:MAG: hypothetical protein KKE51_19615 [Gammaproteobacteria bacterium]|nr:hypothetical protein [Gammaproteobacteria bacterium]MBU1603509.1 hypothetical protein [Gammaproteobacteria bacterium]MBU2433029.1 hypothetical protein [Gammaproteobacteria bacterium]MBU2450272.1 hypothetical protein [Gammaproteobacteria bacterium]